MRKIEHFCDHCGKKFEPYDIRINRNTYKIAHSLSADLCKDCLCELTKIVAIFVNWKEE